MADPWRLMSCRCWCLERSLRGLCEGYECWSRGYTLQANCAVRRSREVDQYISIGRSGSYYARSIYVCGYQQGDFCKEGVLAWRAYIGFFIFFNSSSVFQYFSLHATNVRPTKLFVQALFAPPLRWTRPTTDIWGCYSQSTACSSSAAYSAPPPPHSSTCAAPVSFLLQPSASQAHLHRSPHLRGHHARLS